MFVQYDGINSGFRHTLQVLLWSSSSDISEIFRLKNCRYEDIHKKKLSKHVASLTKSGSFKKPRDT